LPLPRPVAGEASLIGRHRSRWRRGRQQVFRIDETPARLPETLRGLLFAKAVHIDALFANAGSDPREVTVGRHEAESIESTAVQKIHCVDHQRDVGGVLARRIGKLLLRDDGVFRQDVGPALRAGAGEIAVNAPNAGSPIFAISSKSPSAIFAEALSASMRTARRADRCSVGMGGLRPSGLQGLRRLIK
jgi:hypothetical protein